MKEDIILDELIRLKVEFRTYQNKYKKGTKEFIFYEGSLNGVSGSVDRIKKLYNEG